ncbi:hypothetical protein [uncultured Aquimarina sp.]|uniref:hypothetical protein n=1 Tax=uncultured Aquimarina sp. TaxID=575652 RepID=UPI002624F925|nr:hypothetical protein [uncultured Aquimarina sp.]
MKSILLLITLCMQMTYSQNTKPNQEVKRLIELGRDHIIDLALKKIKEQEIEDIKKDDFHFIKVKASDQRILVELGYNVLYLPKNTSYYSGISVEFPSKFVSKSSVNNDGENTTFYRPTSEYLKVINFIMNPDGTRTDIFNKGKRWSPTIIYEKEKHYLVDFSARDPEFGGGFSKEEIDKETGEVLSTLSGHYARMSEDMFPRDLSGEKIEREEFIEISN